MEERERDRERMKERHQWEQRGIGENAEWREKKTQASGAVKQSDIDSAMAV